MKGSGMKSLSWLDGNKRMTDGQDEGVGDLGRNV